MAVLVDTSVWVDFFAGAAAGHVAVLERLVNEGEDLSICGVILTEVLQGIRADRPYRETKRRLDSLLFLPMTRDTFVKAAALYRSLRRKGITLRKSVDCMIAAVAIEHNVALLHHDRDFESIERHSDLQVVRLDR